MNRRRFYDEAERADRENDGHMYTPDELARAERLKAQFLADTAPIHCGKQLDDEEDAA